MSPYIRLLCVCGEFILTSNIYTKLHSNVQSLFSSTVNTLQLKLKNAKMTNDDLSTQVYVQAILNCKVMCFVQFFWSRLETVMIHRQLIIMIHMLWFKFVLKIFKPL